MTKGAENPLMTDEYGRYDYTEIGKYPVASTLAGSGPTEYYLTALCHVSGEKMGSYTEIRITEDDL
jgi:hypothetical protein